MLNAIRQVRIAAILYGVVGVAVCGQYLAGFHPADWTKFLIYLACAMITSLGMRITANEALIPAGFLILLLGFNELSLAELLVIATTATFLREVRGSLRWEKVFAALYSAGSIAVGIVSAYWVFQNVTQWGLSAIFPAPLIGAAAVFLFNWALAAALRTDPKTKVAGFYRRECRPLLPWYVAAAYLAYLVTCASHETHWHAAVIATPLLFVFDRGYRMWSQQKAEHKRELDELHRRTLDTLSIAIDSRDHSTQMHLRRVQVYAEAVGKNFGLSEVEIESLNIAALLHDIGKLGIPDHILLKPGRLTDEEWEKMKTHPLIGADMLKCMKYPESVVAIVRAHHEKWDGTGYPNALSGREIPLGARILTAVDCLDALASERPYRRALPLSEALTELKKQRGRAFDPEVVDVLERRVGELEAQTRKMAAAANADAKSPQHDLAKLASRLLMESGKTSDPFLMPIVSARHETQLLQNLSTELAGTRHLDDVLSCAQKCVAQLLNYDTLAIYITRDDMTEPAGVGGRNADFFSKSLVPSVRGLSGMVSRTGTPVLNGNPESEAWYLYNELEGMRLASVLSVPLGANPAIGALTLYRTDKDAFTRDDLRILQAIAGHVGPAVENAVRFQDAKVDAGTDHLTGVANARSLSTHLKRELSRAARDGSTIGVLVCDLDGFKPVNDRFGHLKGNEVLQLVAKGMRETCRASDYIARMGGDEFIVIVPGYRRDKAAWYLERLRQVAIDAGVAACGEECVSLSIGDAIFPRDGNDAESVIAEADRRMYIAKEQGKAARLYAEHT